MFFFFPFYSESKPVSNGSNSFSAIAWPLLPAPGATNSKTTERARDFGDSFVDFLRQTITAYTSSLTALGNAANALFAQATAAFAMERAGRNAASLFGPAWFGFAAPRAQGFGASRSMQDPMSFSPLLMQGFNPWAMNPWGAFAEGLNFWASLWMPAPPQRSAKLPVAPFMAKVSTPNGFTWGFSWGV